MLTNPSEVGSNLMTQQHAKRDCKIAFKRSSSFWRFKVNLTKFEDEFKAFKTGSNGLKLPFRSTIFKQVYVRAKFEKNWVLQKSPLNAQKLPSKNTKVTIPVDESQLLPHSHNSLNFDHGYLARSIKISPSMETSRVNSKTCSSNFVHLHSTLRPCD